MTYCKVTGGKTKIRLNTYVRTGVSSLRKLADELPSRPIRTFGQFGHACGVVISLSAQNVLGLKILTRQLTLDVLTDFSKGPIACCCKRTTLVSFVPAVASRFVHKVF